MKIFPILLFAILAFASCNNTNPHDAPYLVGAGFTQGTTYHIAYQCPTKDSIELTTEIDALLHDFDMSLSTYIDSSIISRINKNEPGIQTDAYFNVVYDEAKRIYDLTDGKFDITVGPLINAWGFGPDGKKENMSKRVIDSLLLFVGMEKISLEGNTLHKEHPEIYLDVNAIAQGYAVDIVVDLLKSKKIKNFMVEIGGEIRTNGLNKNGKAWRIGVDKPFYGNKVAGQELQNVINLSGKSLASSGNYRKYYEVDGKKIVHTLDPKTGYTRMSELLSVTIICDECITADAIATSCMVMGLIDGKKFVEGLEGVEAYFIYSDESGLYFEWFSEGMKELL